MDRYLRIAQPFLPPELKEIKKCLLGFPDGAVQIIQRPSKNSEHSCYFERKKWSAVLVSTHAW